MEQPSCEWCLCTLAQPACCPVRREPHVVILLLRNVWLAASRDFASLALAADDDFYLDVSAACASDSSLSSFSSHSAGSASAALEPGAQQGLPEGLLFLPADPSGSSAEQQAQQQAQLGAHPPADPQQAQHAQRQWAQLPPDLRRGVHLAAAVRSALKQQLGITLSCGVARNKLLARLASPCGKPDGLAVVPDGAERAFIAQVPLRKVPQLR